MPILLMLESKVSCIRLKRAQIKNVEELAEPLNRHNFFFLGREMLIDLADVLVRQLL